MILEILGSGTSHGVPVIGCDCAVCHSSDVRDVRYRASALLRSSEEDPHSLAILIDATPEFRLQAIRSFITRLDALLLTHAHADHVHGLDDVRIFTNEKSLLVYAESFCVHEVYERFSYIFRKTQKGGGKPQLEFHAMSAIGDLSIMVQGIALSAIPLQHGSLTVFGWRFGDTAYLTDCNFISDESLVLLKGIKNMVIDALRIRPHSTHCNFMEALAYIEKIQPEKAWFTHITHESSHVEIIAFIEEEKKHRPSLHAIEIAPAYDGLKIPVVV